MSRLYKHIFACALATLIFIISMLGSNNAQASHIYGADLYYTHVSGNTYTVTLVIYGDCAGGAFPNLLNSTADVRVLNGSSLYTTVTLLKQNPTAGTEVTPVCPSQIGNTKCTSLTNTIPGVKQFTYSRNVTLNTTSSNWRFRFEGVMTGGASAGRSGSITNIGTAPTNGLMTLEATLNNTNTSNSSPTYTTIPTPFFCINKAGSYNPGTIDANGDSLTYSLVPGLYQTSTVTYLTGYSATSPLAAATGTFNFSAQTGQLNFTPNLVQQSLVVTQVNEYRNGVLVGTSMREMTFVVINNCNNNPPGGIITNNNNGTVFNAGKSIKICKSKGSLTFTINATDQDNDSVNIVANGIPTGATFTVTNNNTTSASGAFSWNLTTAAAGTYNFFITYTDYGCPLASKQTVAYTVQVLPDPTVAITIDTLATCTKKARFTMTPSVSPSPWNIQITQGATVIHTFNNLTGAQKDSLSPGTYNVRVTNADTCFKDIPLVIDPPPTLGIALQITPLLCHDDSDAIVVVVPTGGKSPFSFAKNSSSYDVIDTFKNLYAGFYTFKIKDENECLKDTIIQIVNPLPISADVTLYQPPCNYFNSGIITIKGKNGKLPYTYSFNNNPYSPIDSFSGLYSGNYPVIIKDSNGCFLDTNVILPDSVKVSASAVLTDILCNKDSTGSIVMTASGATAPYRYRLNGWTSLTPTNTFYNLPAGIFSIRIEDTNKCYLDTNVVLQEPVAILNTKSVTDVLCFGDATGSITVSGIGGVGPYTYALGAGTYSSSGTFSPLSAGTYSIHIKDANNCIKDTNIVVLEPNELLFDTIKTTEPDCFGGQNGQVILTGKGGVTPYEFAISTGTFSGTGTFNTVSAGGTLFRIRDNNSCLNDTIVQLSQPTRIVPSAAVTKSTCKPLNNGEVSMSASGGTPGYTYAIGAGAFSTTSVFPSLAAGTYLFRTRDNNNCVIDSNITILDSFTVKVGISVNGTRCYDSASGLINIIASGGVSPYKYSVGGGTFTSVPAIGSLYAGSYNVVTVDNIGCAKDTLVNVSQPTFVAPALTVSSPSCSTYQDGIINISVTGGTPAYTYALNGGNFGTVPVFNALGAGQYIVSVMDVNNCRRDTSVTMTQPPGVYFSTLVSNLKCYRDNSGTVQVTATGGTSPYRYTFNNNPYQTNSLLSGLGAGANIIKVKDIKECIVDTTITLTEPAQLLITNPLITDATCKGYADGAVKVYGNGGVKPYEFRVNGGIFSSSNTFDNLKEGENVVRIKDANDCLYDTTLIVGGLPAIIVDELITTDVLCFDSADGKLEVLASGGVQPFKYKLTDSTLQSSALFNNLKSDKFTLTIVDSAGCILDTAIEIGSPDKLEVTTKVTPNDCEGYENTSSIDAYAKGGTPAYEYMWNTLPQQTGYNIKGMPNGTYTVIVKDAHDCIDTAIATIEYNNCCIVFVPDAFTPNGDGLNDIMRMRVKGDFDLETFSIYNRFGQRVYNGTNIDMGWDGKLNGVMQDLGTYNYYIKGICGNSGKEEIMYKGTITLVR